MNHTHAIATTDTSIAIVQRACDCGGNCENCQNEASDIQPKLTIGAPNDNYEQEADRIAERVVSSPTPALAAPITTTPLVQRTEASHEMEEEPLQLKPASIQRMETDTEEEEQALQTKPDTLQSTGGGDEEEENVQLKSLSSSPLSVSTKPSATAIAAAAVANGGTPLSHNDRAYFEPRFGHDLSHVRLHTDATAGQAARSINARAYTLRHNIAFAPGQHNPATTDGRRLLAHELTHTLQQVGAKNRIPQRPRATDVNSVTLKTDSRTTTDDTVGD